MNTKPGSRVKPVRAFPQYFGPVRWVIGSNLRLHPGWEEGGDTSSHVYAFTMQTSTLAAAAAVAAAAPGSLFDARLFLERPRPPRAREELGEKTSEEKARERCRGKTGERKG